METFAACPGSGRENAAGFSLVEVMVAITLLTILSLGVLASMVVGFSADRSTQEIARSQQFAVQVLETVKSTPYDLLPTLSGITIPQNDLEATVGVSVLSAGLQRIEISVIHASEPAANSRLVTLRARLD